ncbi:MAG: TIGR01212 family radical SAM protein [Bacteroidales bacterium]|nr:TIGR01212 family radical SAM protein [Bacteroidales bacterium]
MFGFPEGKRYNTSAGRYRRIYGERLQKLVIDAGFSCPNRDGTLGTGGCSYCDNAAFHPGYSVPGKSLHQQIDEGIEFHRRRYPKVNHYLAYFQAYSNTYAPLERLRELYGEALSHPSVVGLVIGTRPDCIDEEKLDYLAGIQRKTIVVEYGIESCYDETLRRINRGHDFECARKAVEMTAERGLDVGAHFILGLPGETRQMLLDQCAAISALPLTSVKFHQLQIVKGTRMEKEYAACPEDFLRLGLDDYLDLVIDILERLRPDLCIERVAGEVPPRFVSETPWGLIRNDGILRLLDHRLEERDTFQGRLYNINNQ